MFTQWFSVVVYDDNIKVLWIKSDLDSQIHESTKLPEDKQNREKPRCI
jgi:hypothetical protein